MTNMIPAEKVHQFSSSFFYVGGRYVKKEQLYLKKITLALSCD